MKLFVLSVGAFVCLIALAALAVISALAFQLCQWLRSKPHPLAFNPVRKLRR
jgi:hypothetical protein